MEKEIGEIDFAKSGGIVPVIVQDADTLKVLTLAYANKEALDLAKKTGNSWFWSRSRNKLWMRGIRQHSDILEILFIALFFWLLAYAKVRTLSVSASCTITGTMPPLFAKSISPISFSMHKADSCTL